MDDHGTLVRERKGLERLRDLEAPSDIHKWIFDIAKVLRSSRAPHLKHPLVDRLNERQEWAVRSALAAPDVYFIQGPPGTGKTTVIAELVNQITQEGERVMVASQTNLAVDNALGASAIKPMSGQFAGWVNLRRLILTLNQNRSWKITLSNLSSPVNTK